MYYSVSVEIAALLVVLVLLYDMRSKPGYEHRETRMFHVVLWAAALECAVNLLSSLLLRRAAVVPLVLNVAAATAFFVMQAAMIYSLVLFSYVYMNSHFERSSVGFWVVTAAFLANLILSLTTPWTGFYFVFDGQQQYLQGWGTDWSGIFFVLNVLLCLIYMVVNRRHLLLKDMKVAGVVAAFVCVGIAVQMLRRDILIVDFSIAMTVLYLYITLENPNDCIDKLTRCENGYSFKQSIDARCRRGRPYSVLFLNVNKFRYVNAIYGTEAGDRVLQKIALFLEDHFHGKSVYRLQGDQFAVIGEGAPARFEQEVQGIVGRFRMPWAAVAEAEVTLEVSVLVCDYPHSFDSHTELVRLKEQMERTQRLLRGQSVLYADAAIAERCRRTEQIEAIVKRALAKRTLDVYFQPIVNGEQGTVISLEALARLNDPEYGFISPAEFIPLAEATRDIIPMGIYVLEKACEFVRDVLLPDPANTVECVHVNVSTLQFEDRTFCASVKAALQSCGVPPCMIQLELTESAMLSSPEIVAQTMRELSVFGIQFALDDYGTGNSNISYLIRFPFREIKFDKNIVHSFFEQEEAGLIIRNEFRTLQQLHKAVIVEGVETEQQYRALCEQGICLFQGFYFAKPLPEQACRAYLAQHFQNHILP